GKIPETFVTWWQWTVDSREGGRQDPFSVESEGAWSGRQGPVFHRSSSELVLCVDTKEVPWPAVRPETSPSPSSPRRRVCPHRPSRASSTVVVTWPQRRGSASRSCCVLMGTGAGAGVLGAESVCSAWTATIQTGHGG